ncbi:alkaline phosphatase family protein [Saccharicrinis sp. FJH62]|uniref:alkaline phosphatase family protein n=1 Tax=Saccharicrinis sp. FJH62 TaxID=3344657 RepID=UPI0035D4AC1E
MKSKLIYSLIACLLIFSTGVNSQIPVPPEKPKLIIGIVIDQMHPDYLNRYYNNFTEKGFRIFIDNGYTFSNASYSYAFSHKGPDHATLVTGTTPRYHGITGIEWYNRKTLKTEPITADERAITIGLTPSQSAYNAANMNASTIGDELKLSTYGNSKVVSVALEPTQAVLLAGHAADGAYWLDEKTGKIISSDAYMAWLPDWVDAFNLKNFPAFYMKAKWDLLLPENKYLYDAKKRIYKDYSLPQSFESNASKPNPYAFLKATPFGNMILKDFVIDAIKGEKLGEDDFTDLLFVNFSSLGQKALEYGPYSIEMEDNYIRLDREIEDLIKTVEKEVGRNNVLFFLTGSQRAPINPEYLEEYNIPSGYFKTDRAMALLNTYLMAFYGQGRWVEHYYGQQIYLNKELIESSKISFKEVQDKTAAFMKEFTGVAFAAPTHLFSENEYQSGVLKKMQESYNKEHCGDVFLMLEPGWIEEPGDDYNNEVYGLSDTRVPLSFYGWKVGRGESSQPVKISDIIPTICSMTGIPMPNSATGTPIKALNP